MSWMMMDKPVLTEQEARDFFEANIRFYEDAIERDGIKAWIRNEIEHYDTLVKFGYLCCTKRKKLGENRMMVYYKLSKKGRQIHEAFKEFHKL